MLYDDGWLLLSYAADRMRVGGGVLVSSLA
jgi:hypothetical protein